MRFNIPNHSFLKCAVFILLFNLFILFPFIYTRLPSGAQICGGYVMYLYIRFDFLIHRTRFLFAYCFCLFLFALCMFYISALDASSYVLFPAIMIYKLFL